MSAPRLRQPLRLALRKRSIYSSSLLTARYYATTSTPADAAANDRWEVDMYGFGRKPGDPPPKYKEPPKRRIPDHSFFPLPTKRMPEIHKSFAVYAPPARSKLGVAPKNPMPTLARREIKRLDPTGVRTALFRRDAKDAVKPGDVLRVTSTKGEPFAGVLINLRRRGADTAICLRGRMAGVGVEMWYKVYSTKIVRIDVIWRRPKRARRARLTYMRKPKHDMGSVDHLVDAWFRSRVTVGKAKSKAKTGTTKMKVLKRSKVRKLEAKKEAGLKRVENARLRKEKAERKAKKEEAKAKANGDVGSPTKTEA